MTFGLPGALGNALKYTGDQVADIPGVNFPRAPTTTDRNYPLFTLWRNGNKQATLPDYEGDMWYLARFDATVQPPNAIWHKIATGSVPGGTVISISDTANTAVFPNSAGNIQLVAGANVTITSTPASNLLTIDSSGGGGSAINQITTDVSGPVTPSSNNVNFTGSTSTYTTGSSHTLTTEVQGTNHTLFVGRGTNTPATTITAGVDHSICMGNTGADPGFTTTGTPYMNGLSFDTGTNVLQRFKDITMVVPFIYGATSAGTGTYTEQTLRYSIIGNMLLFNINLLWTAHTGTGDMMVGGFPEIFAAAQSFYPCVCMMQNITLPANTKWVVLDGVNATTNAEITACIDGAPFAPVQMSNAGSLHVSGWYPIG